AVASPGKPGQDRKAGEGAELSHQGVHGLSRPPRRHEGWRWLAARSFHHPVRQQHVEQRQAQQRSTAFGRIRSWLRQDQGWSASALSAEHAACQSAADTAESCRCAGREARRQHRHLCGGLSTVRKMLWPALLAPLLVMPAWAAPRAELNAQLFEALKAQDPETALYALSEGAEATAHEPDGTTPLHYAAHFADVRLITALLKAKADA